MRNVQTRLETLAHRLQSIVATSSGEPAPITQREAYDQIVEELELAGYGAPIIGDFTSAQLSEFRRQTAN